MDLRELVFYFDFLKLIVPFVGSLVVQKAQSVVHKFTYRPSSKPLNVIVVGGSFAGSVVAQRLAHTLPSGYRVILIEKNTHFNYVFGFPRNAVFTGREHHAFIPYDNLAAGTPDGVFHQICDEVTDVTDEVVITLDGLSLAYEYLVISTGADQPTPARLHARSKDDAIEELRGFQDRITNADRIAVIGGGAVGIELATEAKARHPEKTITLIHSRQQLLPRFGPKLHGHVLAELQSQGIEVLLGERPAYPSDAGQAVQETVLTFANGETKTFDLVIPCIGQRPRSDLLKSYSPKSIADSGEIRVKPTLQVDNLSPNQQNVFAVGDVAQSGGVKQGRAGHMQAEIAVQNILQLIKGGSASKKYVPHWFENTLQLTLGKKLSIMYVQKGDYEFLKETKGADEDVGVQKMKWHLNTK
ncbi:apoptosis-inducing factor [Fusarium heterosporum]|uniref:Apoptosis-inducing factor n=1 Tax=Fusarium heterosporum TaxID=42747 RepID=A0A8H5T9P0_FUSHE|nr:apoptosis-inducing factor [Fusarium heterosporum]